MPFNLLSETTLLQNESSWKGGEKNDIRCKRKSTILIIANNYSALHHLTGHLMRGRQSTRPFFYYNVFFEIFNPSNPTHYFLAVLSANSESTRRNTGVISSFDISLPSLILSAVKSSNFTLKLNDNCFAIAFAILGQ